MRSCRQITEQASDYLDQGLPWHKRVAFRFHLFLCKTCYRHVCQLRQMIAGVKHIKQPPPDKETLRKITDYAKEQSRNKQP